MVLITLDEPDPNNPEKKLSFYMDDKLKHKLDKQIIPQFNEKDEDVVFIVDGKERTGKSVFAMQLAKYLDHSFGMDRLCFKPLLFKKRVLEIGHKKAIIFDEGYRGLSSRKALSEINNILISLMMEMGQKNLIVIVVLPTFYMLDKYPALFRAKGLFHIFKSHNRKGYWRYYNEKKKALLYSNPLYKKLFKYNIRTKFRGRFYNKYMVNEQEYRVLKGVELNETMPFKEQTHKWIIQRDKLVYAIYKNFIKNVSEVGIWCKKNDIELNVKSIEHIITEYKANDKALSRVQAFRPPKPS